MDLSLFLNVLSRKNIKKVDFIFLTNDLFFYKKFTERFYLSHRNRSIHKIRKELEKRAFLDETLLKINKFLLRFLSISFPATLQIIKKNN